MTKLRNCPICNTKYEVKDETETISMIGHVYSKVLVSELHCNTCGFTMMVPGCDFDTCIEFWNNIRRPKDGNLHDN